MTVISLASKVFPNYNGGGATASVRIYSNQDFLTSTDVPINETKPVGPVWYKQLNCTVSGTNLTVPAFTIDSNTDSNKTDGTYSFTLHDANGRYKDYLFKNLRIPHDYGSPLGWEDVITFNAEEPLLYSLNQGYSIPQMNALLAALEAQIVANGTPISDFNAVGDLTYGFDGAIGLGATQFNSASAQFQASAAGNKVIVINGAGPGGAPLVTTIASVNSENQVELADVAATAVTSDALYYYGTDDTAAFQSAIDLTAAAGGGRINLGLKNYLISNELTLPGIEFQNEQVVIIEFVGANGPVTSYWNNTNQVIGGDNDVVLSTEGQTIVQLAKTTAGAKLLDVNWTLPASNAPSGVIFTAKDMVFRVPTKSNVTGLDLQYAYSARLLNVNVEPADHQSNLDQPVAGSFGVRLPRIGNGGGIYCKELHVTGFETGLRHAEHTVLDHIWVHRCQFGIMVDATHLASEYRRVMINTCPYGIISESNTPVTPKAFIYGGPIDFEDSFSIASPAAHWSAPRAHINDPGDNLRGELAYLKSVGFLGYERGIIAFGASQLLRKEVGQLLYDGGVEGIGVLPFDAPLVSPIGEPIPPEVNTGQKFMFASGVSMNVFDVDGAFFDDGDGNCFARLEAEQKNYSISVRIDIDALQTQCEAGICLKYIQGGVGLTGGTFIGATIEMLPGPVNQLRLFKVVNATSEDLGTDTSVVFAANNDYVLRVDYNDGDIEVFVDGVSKITATLDADELAIFDLSKVFGLYSYIAAGNDDRKTQFRELVVNPL